MQFTEIERWIRERDPNKLETLWSRADTVRRESVGDQVHLRGLIEISNICRRQCLYCGIRAGNQGLNRYRLTAEEIWTCAQSAVQFGYGSIVLQSGEHSGLDSGEIAKIIEKIKKETRLAITLSLGERSLEDWKRWKNAGADRYLLRFETSNSRLFRAIHPPLLSEKGQGKFHNRIEMLRELRSLGYETGSGIMVGIPGQSYADVAKDVQLFRDLRLHMIGLGPFLPHPETPLGKIFPAPFIRGKNVPDQWSPTQIRFFREHEIEIIPPKEQVSDPGVLPFTLIALVRILCPFANIPTTTAIATLDAQNGRKSGLSRGANVVMPNLTPMKYREMYDIYPNKAAKDKTPAETHQEVRRQLAELGRVPGTGPGNSLVDLQHSGESQRQNGE